MINPADIPLHVFRAYDVRGLTPEPLSPAFAMALGVGLGAVAKKQNINTIALGRDGRHSSAALADAVGQGLRQSGVDVLDVGLVATPLLYFAAHTRTGGNGVMVTASHNPPQYNGFKVDLNGVPLDAAQWTAVRERMVFQSNGIGDGAPESHDVVEHYLDALTDRIKLERPLRIIVDGSNGPGGNVLVCALERLGCEVRGLACDVDGAFPAHAPDPSRSDNYATLQRAVIDNGADMGLMLDGDADRLGMVDERGQIVWPDTYMMLFCIDVLARRPGATIVFDVKCSRRLADTIRRHGGTAVMGKSGHALTRRNLLQRKAVLAGEFSGHIFCADQWYGFDDGLFAACWFAQIISRHGSNVSSAIAALPQAHSTPELRILLKEGEAISVMHKLMQNVSFPGGQITTLDGVRIDFEHGWALVRASNTLPALTLRYEADTPAELARIRQVVEAWIDSNSTVNAADAD